MKRKSIVFVAAVTAIFLAAPTALFAMPGEVRTAFNEAQEDDQVVATGVSEVRHLSTARRIATLDARERIAGELNLIVDTWHRIENQNTLAYGDEILDETEQWFGHIAQTISRAEFSGARVIFEYRASDGHYWVVMSMPRATAEAVIVSAATSADIELATNRTRQGLGQHEGAARSSMADLERAFSESLRH